MTYSVDLYVDVGVDDVQVRRTVESASDYYPYGKALRSYGKERYQSTYHERDVESGFDYRGARFYDGDVVRFNSLDPHASDYASWSDYNYVLGNPNAYTDPDGRAPFNEYVVDKETGQVKKVGDKGGDETDYIYWGTIKNDEEGNPVTAIWSEKDAIELEVEVEYTPGPGGRSQDEDPTPGLRLRHGKTHTDIWAYNLILSWYVGGASGSTSTNLGFAAVRHGASRSAFWSATKTKGAVKNAFDHWRKHKAEFPEFQNAKQYVEGAKSFLKKPPAGTFTKVRKNGDILRYDPKTNTFGVSNANGAPKTLFRPTDGIKYWLKQ